MLYVFFKYRSVSNLHTTVTTILNVSCTQDVLISISVSQESLFTITGTATFCASIIPPALIITYKSNKNIFFIISATNGTKAMNIKRKRNTIKRTTESYDNFPSFPFSIREQMDGYSKRPLHRIARKKDIPYPSSQHKVDATSIRLSYSHIIARCICPDTVF